MHVAADLIIVLLNVMIHIRQATSLPLALITVALFITVISAITSAPILLSPRSTLNGVVLQEIADDQV